ncbi:hypothetical protein E1258_08195 [Micromonospora sp. KC207]|uniref:hypothetical protein n=1 Tax=Micromonospora sp. KC207 TaxID=2530377 RepID=UPI00104948A0|nr:hypothetical protein [Micromonospora sp. KC207]TDC64450.1 hypothetical protein E1258_08195 [Micromonospora sp. KC207]
MRLIGRLSFAGALGALGAAALASLWRTEALLVASCEPETIGACFSWRLPTIFVGPLIVTALVWLALRVTGADRALPAALLGAIATTDAVLLYEAFQPRWTPPPAWLAAALGAVGFAVGVLLGAVRLPMAVQAGAAVVLLLVPIAVFPLLHKATRRAERAQAFSRLGVPLMVAEVDGYRVTAALTDRSDRRLSVWMSKGESSLSIVVVPLPEGFAPPAHCGPTTDDLYRDQPAGDQAAVRSCRPVGPDHWVRTEREDQVHLIRRNDALVYVDPGADVPAADVATAAANLTEVNPERLAELAVR